MTFVIDMAALMERAAKRAADHGYPATPATRLPDSPPGPGSQVAKVAAHARELARKGANPLRKGANPLMTMEQGNACHAEGWSDAEIHAFTSRRDRLLRWGYSVPQANDLAERLTLRDRDLDDRHLCLECSHLRTSGRCAAAALGHLAGADPRMQPPPAILMRCPAFKGVTPCPP